MLIEGRIAQLVVMLTTIIMMVYYINAIKKGKEVTLRKIPGFDAIDEAVGRAIEMGRPIHFTPGFTMGGLYNPKMGPQVVAGISILKKIAEITANKGGKLIVSLNQSEAVPLVDDIIKNAYRSANREPPIDATRFISTEQFSYASGVLGLLREEKPGANFLMGNFLAESLLFAEGGNYIGAMQIAATAELSQLPFFVVSCNYTIIGEEIYAAKAYVEKDPGTLGSLLSQDILRAISIVIITLLWLGTNLQFPWFLKLIKM